jgi:protein kinase X
LYKSKKQLEHVKNEKAVLTTVKEFKSSFYANLYETLQDKNCFYYVLDFIPGGELCSFLRNKLTIEQAGVQFYTSEVLIALEELHKHNIVYRDLKTENIIID